MPIDPVLIIGVGVPKIIGQGGDRREFKTGDFVEICITETVIESSMPLAQIDNAVSVVVAHRNAAPAVDHKIVHTLIPF
jgi:hypothetical protein